MSKSLNSDYLSQLYIRADTKSMDKELVKSEVATSGLPEEARALVVFKRGYATAFPSTVSYLYFHSQTLHCNVDICQGQSAFVGLGIAGLHPILTKRITWSAISICFTPFNSNAVCV